MLPASPHAGRSSARRPALPQTRSVSRPRERGAPGQAVDYESGVAMANRERDRAQRSETMRQVRPQRSMGNLPSSSTRDRSAAPPMPMPRPFDAPATSRPFAGPSSNQRPLPRAGSASSDTSLSSMAALSSSSSGSSFLERMRAGKPGSVSSQSSLELEPEERPREGANGRWYGSRERQVARQTEKDAPEALRDRNMSPTTQPQHPNQDLESSSYTTYGYSIWNRIATAAGSLAENVNVAWAGGNFSSSAEDVPGQETNLTKTLKAYYLGKARSRAELPEWLFSDAERRGPSGSSSSRQRQADDRDDEERQETRMPDTRRRGFRDGGATAGSSSSSAPALATGSRDADNMNTRAVDESSAYGGSKATNRLRALRDAKRQAALAGRGAQSSFSGSGSDASAAAAKENESSSTRYGVDDATRSRSQSTRQGEIVRVQQEGQMPKPKPRMGLPANPRRR